MKYSQCLAGRYVILKEFYLWQRRFWEHQIRDEADYSVFRLYAVQS